MCPNENAITQSDVAQCNKAKADAKCGAAYSNVLRCAGANLVCGRDGKVDSQAFAAGCKTQTDAYVQCISPNPGPPVVG